MKTMFVISKNEKIIRTSGTPSGPYGRLIGFVECSADANHKTGACKELCEMLGCTMDSPGFLTHPSLGELVVESVEEMIEMTMPWIQSKEYLVKHG